MITRILVAVMILLAAAPAAHAGYGAGDPRLSKLYSTFMAPCCYGGDLTVHDSAAASELRGRIERMVKEGRTDEQIKSTLVAEYGSRILSVPEGSAHTWLFYMPGVFVAIGLAVVLLFLKRMRRAAPEPEPEARNASS
jgi:cytochrome c-type biogenesis protein CcmH/NrfF